MAYFSLLLPPNTTKIPGHYIYKINKKILKGVEKKTEQPGTSESKAAYEVNSTEPLFSLCIPNFSNKPQQLTNTHEHRLKELHKSLLSSAIRLRKEQPMKTKNL